MRNQQFYGNSHAMCVAAGVLHFSALAVVATTTTHGSLRAQHHTKLFPLLDKYIPTRIALTDDEAFKLVSPSNQNSTGIASNQSFFSREKCECISDNETAVGIWQGLAP
jgi:hypothetical protein